MKKDMNVLVIALLVSCSTPVFGMHSLKRVLVTRSCLRPMARCFVPVRGIVMPLPEEEEKQCSDVNEWEGILFCTKAIERLEKKNEEEKELFRRKREMKEQIEKICGEEETWEKIFHEYDKRLRKFSQEKVERQMTINFSPRIESLLKDIVSELEELNRSNRSPKK